MKIVKNIDYSWEGSIFLKNTLILAQRGLHFHKKIVVWLDVFDKKSNFTRQTEGHFSKNIVFVQSRNAAELAGRASV